MCRFFLIIAVTAGLWATTEAQFDPHCSDNRKPIVQLFEWRWEDIANECRNFLAKAGYCGVQVSPPNENRIVMADVEKRPWWERYEPVSYVINTRSGDEAAFVDMVKRCNDVGVRIYVDAVLNNMVNEDAKIGAGTAGSRFSATTLDFPGVPYLKNDFNEITKDCKSNSGSIENMQDATEIRNCRRNGLIDLKQSRSFVRQILVRYLNKLLGFGVAGFQIESAKYMWPEDIKALVNSLNNLNTKWFPANSKPFIYQEVEDLGGPIKASEYFDNGKVTEFHFGLFLTEVFNGERKVSLLKNFAERFVPDAKAVAFVDNPALQRGVGGFGTFLHHKKHLEYNLAVSFMLAYGYGQPRIMSSYNFDKDWNGPPSDESTFETKQVIITESGSCTNRWVCEHRWPAIEAMVEFSNVAGSEKVANWWDDGDNQIAFSRGNKAFFALNGGDKLLQQSIQTGLKPGRYCALISGTLSEDKKHCDGPIVDVGQDGTASLKIPAEPNQFPMLAIHVERAMLEEEPVEEPFNFNPNCAADRKTIVQLFEWRWEDVAQECERFLAKNGYCGVHVSPPNEHRIIMEKDIKRPWYERYQSVSYQIYSRSGDEKAFSDMVKRCNDVGVRIYADVVINHMVIEGSGIGTGIGGCSYNVDSLKFPCVPYNSTHFHTKGVDCLTKSGRVENWQDASEMRNCRLEGLTDLDQSKPYVREKIVQFLNKLIDIGVAGFRFDSAMYVAPADLQAIIGGLKKLDPKWFPRGAKPFIFQSVKGYRNDASKATDYSSFARVTEYNYAKQLSEFFNGKKALSSLKNFGSDLLAKEAALVFVDNHDSQRNENWLSFLTPRQYKMAVTFMLANPYGLPSVMSSYRWERKMNNGKDENFWMGPPHDKRFNTLPVTFKKDGTCENDWVCEHRWNAVANMVQFRGLVGEEPLANWWDDKDSQFAFSRGGKGFFAVNGGSRHMSVTLQTGLPVGRYCDLITGGKTQDGTDCTGRVVRVNGNGEGLIILYGGAEEPMVAITLDSKVSSDPGPEPTEPTTTPTQTPLPDPRKRTIIFLEYMTTAGQDLFLRGGISHTKRPTCSANPVACWIPIGYSHASYNTKHYEKYNTWSQGDTVLDWTGPENGQGRYAGEVPEGSPMAWTTNGPVSDNAYNHFNTYGPNYWMLDVMMDCSVTEDGWFEVKALLDDKWETDIIQNDRCEGNAGLSTGYKSNNHLARCGYKNVFKNSQGSCRIDII